MCFVFISEQTATSAPIQRNWLVFITGMKSVYCAVRTGSLNKSLHFVFKWLRHILTEVVEIEPFYRVFNENIIERADATWTFLLTYLLHGAESFLSS